MTVLVTGGSGLVGEHLKELAPVNWLYLNGRKDCDLKNPVEVDYMFKFIKPSVVVHLAADVGGIQYNMNNQPELLSNNLLMNTNIINSANKYGAKVLGMLSTCIYPDVKEPNPMFGFYPMTEEMVSFGTPPETNYGYAMSKRLMLDHANLSNKKYGTKHSFLIPSNLYGKYDNFFSENSHFISSLIGKVLRYKEINHLLEKKDIKIWGDGTPLRQFTYAEDLANIIKIFVERQINTTVNIAAENLSIKKIVEIANRTIGPFDYVFETDRPNGQYRKDVSTNLLNKTLGYQFKFTKLEDGIKEVYDYIIK